jgi:four helix bundle suffix protein
MDTMDDMDPLIAKHGGYRKLKSFQVAQLVYDITARFCDRYINPRSRTHDQMVQAARSGVQNIAEGSQASGTSKKMELKLTNVARASLEELRLDYEDFLRQRSLRQWDAFDPRNADLIVRRPKTAEDVAKWAQDIHEGKFREAKDIQGKSKPRTISTHQTKISDRSGSSIRSIPSITPIPPTYPEIAANGALALIVVACSLLDRQLSAQSKSFQAEGGFTEKLHRIRTQSRRKPPP